MSAYELRMHFAIVAEVKMFSRSLSLFSLVSIRFKVTVFTINIHNIPLHVPVFYIQFYFTL